MSRSAPCLSRTGCFGSDQPVHEDEQAQPDHVHEVPVPGHRLEPEVMLGREVPFDAAEQDHREHDRAQGHVEAVETGQHVEGGTVDATTQREVQLRVRMAVFVGLKPDKQETQHDGGSQAPDELRTVTLLQAPVRPGDGYATRQQYQGVDGGYTPGPHGLEVATHVRRPVARPHRFERGPQQLAGSDVAARSAKPGDGKFANVKQGAEEGREEHDFGENEPAHGPTERLVHLVVVLAPFALPDNDAEPAEQHDHEDDEADAHEGHAAAVQEVGKSCHGAEQTDRSDQGPGTLVGQEITAVCFAHFLSLHVKIFVVCAGCGRTPLPFFYFRTPLTLSPATQRPDMPSAGCLSVTAGKKV